MVISIWYGQWPLVILEHFLIIIMIHCFSVWIGIMWIIINNQIEVIPNSTEFLNNFFLPIWLIDKLNFLTNFYYVNSRTNLFVHFYIYRSLDTSLYNKVNEIQEDVSSKQQDLHTANIHMAAMKSQVCVCIGFCPNGDSPYIKFQRYVLFVQILYIVIPKHIV